MIAKHKERQVMCSFFYRSFALVCLGVGLLILFTGCANGTSISPQQTTYSPTADARTNSQAVATASSVFPQPTQNSEPISPAGPLKLFLSCSGPAGRDGFSVTNTHARACAYTTPGAKLDITVNFCNGKPDPSGALQGSVMADANGYYKWSWVPQPDCKGQPIWGWSVTVTAKLNGTSAIVSAASSSDGA